MWSQTTGKSADYDSTKTSMEPHTPEHALTHTRTHTDVSVLRDVLADMRGQP